MASLMLSCGADVATVSWLLGHPHVSTFNLGEARCFAQQNRSLHLRALLPDDRNSGHLYTHAFDEKKREVSRENAGEGGV